MATAAGTYSINHGCINSGDQTICGFLFRQKKKRLNFFALLLIASPLHILWILGLLRRETLAQAIVHEGMKTLATGANPMLLKKGIIAALEAVSDYIPEQSTAVNKHDAIAQIASVSAQDRAIGELVATVMGMVGRDGLITVEDSSSMNFEIEYVEGIQFDWDYLSPYFVTIPGEMKAILNKPYILIYDASNSKNGWRSSAVAQR